MIQLPQPEPDWLKFGAVGVGAAIAWKALALVERLLPKKAVNATAKSGDLPPEHWETRLDTLVDIGKRQTELLEAIAKTEASVEKTLAVMLDRTK